jgi:hypothetical protein
MSSILLGPLALKNKDKKTNLDSVYNSNMQNKMREMEKIQASRDYKRPEYMNQFDELTFDNISEPSAINDSNITSKGKNMSLERDIHFKSGFSEFLHNDMKYDVVDDKNFFHNNMIPHTSRRDFNTNSNFRSGRKLESFTGVSDTYTAKTEKVPLFEPMMNLTNVNGIPVKTDEFEKRFIPSNKNNNGDLPFQYNIRVKPGVGNKDQDGRYSVYRVNPVNVDNLRSEVNQKITYKSKPLETAKKGNMSRATDYVITKDKKPDFREQGFNDLQSTRADVQGPIQTGKYTNVTSMRGESIFYQPGPSVNTNEGNVPNKDMTNYNPSSRESYMNDPTHAVSAVNTKIVMTNPESYTNYETQRASTNIHYEGAVGGTNGVHYIDYKDVPLTTLRQLMIDGDTNIGINGTDKANYVFSNDMVLPTTGRQLISEAQPILGASTSDNHAPVYYNDMAKDTIRQTTSHNIVTNGSSIDKSNAVYYKDKAKDTIRQTTSHNIVTNGGSIDKSNAVYYNDIAKDTIRQTTSHNIITNGGSVDKSNAVYYNDIAKDTIRQTTSHNIVTNANNVNTKIVPTHYTDNMKDTIRQTTSHNIVTNANSSDKNVPTHYTDNARDTIRQTTSHNIVTNANSYDKNVPTHYSDNARDTIRQTTSHNIVSNVNNMDNKNVPTHYTDKAKETIRETTTHNLVTNANSYDKNVPTHYTDKAKETIRQSTSHNLVTNANSSDKNVPTHYTDNARETIRQSTSHNIVANINNIDKSSAVYYNDMAKPTIKQTMLYQVPEMNIAKEVNDSYTGLTDNAKATIKQTVIYQTPGMNVTKDVPEGYVSLTDEAKNTVKQTVIYATPGGRVSNIENGSYTLDAKDIAKPTIKQTTLLRDYTGALNSINEDKVSHEAAFNMTINDRREISTYNRPANGRKDENGPYINRETVELNDPILYSYTPQPFKKLDFTVMPVTDRNTVENIYPNSKPVIDLSSYYISSSRINTLKDNPLVNDIYHQKNISF